MRALLCLTIVATACTSHKVVIVGSEVHAHLGELRRAGQAPIQVLTEGKTEDQYIKSTETIRLDQWVTVNDKRRRIDDLAYRCLDVPAPRSEPIPEDNQCELLVRRDDPFLLRIDRKRVSFGDIGQVALVSALGLGIVGGLVCAIGCDSPYQEISAVTMGTLIVVALIRCAGSSTCHD